MYGTISQPLVNIRCLLCSGYLALASSAAILTFIFNGHRQSYKIHFQLASLHSSCVCVHVLLLFFIELTFCKWEKIQFIFYNRTFIIGGRGAKNKGQNAIWKRRENQIDRAKVSMRERESVQNDWRPMDSSKTVYRCTDTIECGMFHIIQRRPTERRIRWTIEWSDKRHRKHKQKHTHARIYTYVTNSSSTKTHQLHRK